MLMWFGHGQFLISILIDDVTFCKAVKVVMLELKSASEWHAPHEKTRLSKFTFS